MSDADIPTPRRELAEPHAPVYPWAVPVGLLVAVAIVLLDQLTKQFVEAVLVPGRFVPWLGERIGWQLVYNPGGAFGIPAPHWVFLIVTVGVLVLVSRVLPQAPSLAAAVAYGLLLAGAVGNVLDRLLRPGGDGFGTGYVVDFVAWGSFPRFNVADSAITVGFVLLVLAVLVEERRAATAASAAGDGSGGDGPGDDGPGDDGPDDDGPGDPGPDDDAPGGDGPDDRGPGGDGPDDRGPDDDEASP